jgi:hypothetical protein
LLAPGRGLTTNVDAQVAPLYGIDLYTRQQLVEALGSADLLDMHILPALHGLAVNGAPEVSLQAALAACARAGALSDTEHRACQTLGRHIAEAVREDPTAYRVHPKGNGVVLQRAGGVRAHAFLGLYRGEVYLPYRWIERQVVMATVRRAVRESNDEVPVFYNIVLERHAEDKDGYGVVFVDAARKGSLASRLSHSCTPNVYCMSLSIDGHYAIAMFALRDIAAGEELTFDYRCVTDDRADLAKAICLWYASALPCSCPWRLA